MNTQKIDIATLQDPREILDAFGTYALFGLYMRVYWQSLELGDLLLENLFDIAAIAEHQSYENWLGIAVDLLPEWAIMILAEIDTALEGE